MLNYYRKTALKQKKRKQYSQVILKNVSFMESLIHDLKLTYQLDNGMIPLNLQEQNFIRFLKELVIELLNNPEYEQRTIGFESSVETFLFTFDPVLLTRVFQNIILNSFVHGDENTAVTLQISVSDTMLLINVSDNGMGNARRGNPLHLSALLSGNEYQA